MDIKYGKDIWNNLDYYRRLSNLTTYELSPSYAYLDWDKLPPEAQDKIATEMSKPSPLSNRFRCLVHRPLGSRLTRGIFYRKRLFKSITKLL